MDLAHPSPSILELNIDAEKSMNVSCLGTLNLLNDKHEKLPTECDTSALDMNVR